MNRESSTRITPRFSVRIGQGVVLLLQAVKNSINRNSKRLVLDRLLPDLAQLVDALLRRAAFVCPVAKGVADHCTDDGVFAGIDRVTDDGHHLWRERDADFLDARHGTPRERQEEVLPSIAPACVLQFLPRGTVASRLLRFL